MRHTFAAEVLPAAPPSSATSRSQKSDSTLEPHHHNRRLPVRLASQPTHKRLQSFRLVTSLEGRNYPTRSLKKAHSFHSKTIPPNTTRLSHNRRQDVVDKLSVLRYGQVDPGNDAVHTKRLTFWATEEKYPEVDSFVMVNVKQVGPPTRPEPRDRDRNRAPVAEQD